MILGSVNSNIEAIIPLEVVGQISRQQVDAVIDTGFTGFLILPPSLVANLNLAWIGREPGVLADGNVNYFEVYRGTVSWDGQQRSIELQAANTQPLVGMALLEHHALHVEVVAGGSVIVSALP
jgi:clan AA aspartic protease